jgi:hypothetical protein
MLPLAEPPAERRVRIQQIAGLLPPAGRFSVRTMS